MATDPVCVCVVLEGGRGGLIVLLCVAFYFHLTFAKVCVFACVRVYVSVLLFWRGGGVLLCVAF